MRKGYAVCRIIAQALFTFLVRGRVFGTQHVPRAGGVLLVSNHQSFLDPVLATLAIPRECNYMARDTLFRQPQFRRLIEYLNAFPVKRNTADLGAIKETLRRLKAGKVVLTFPEGTRTVDGSIGPMHAGVVLLARKARVPIVPTLILGAFESWPRNAKLPHPRPVLVAYGPPLYTHEHPEWTDDDAVAHVRAAVLALQERYRRHPILHGLRRPRVSDLAGPADPRRG
ncbi:MAG TPA: lysophospholipid acyltransferase family protein [Phycisphaerae bacterium]|nr:lysophospholipid acyltransferase family protein [Phycisphaerae bacterium]